MGINDWLLDTKYINELQYSDKYYLSSLGVHIINYVRDIPIPVKVVFEDGGLIFYIGKAESKFFVVDNNIYYKDFITLVNRWVSLYFPRFEIDYDIEVNLEDEEILNLVKKGYDLNDALAQKRKIPFKEIGVIEKITLKRDEFIFNTNFETVNLGEFKKSLRMSGTLKNPLNLTNFLKDLKEIKEPENKKLFVYDNSIHLRDIDVNKRKIFIAYEGMQMLNFFKINFQDLEDKKLVKVEDYVYHWDNYIIKFGSDSIKNDCISYYESQLLKNKTENSKKIKIKK